MIKRSAEEKFRRFATVPDENGCMNWTGNINYGGYGLIRMSNYNIRAHRFAYEFYIAPIPEGLVLDHLCRNRKCVNPLHLEPVTRGENILRGDRSHQFIRPLYCKQGHFLSVINTYWSYGKRSCKQCSSERRQRNIAKRKELIHPFADD